MTNAGCRSCPQFAADGWQLGRPDLVLEMPAGFDVRATGPDVFRNFVIPTRLTEDKWVRGIEYRPGARKVVHHAIFAHVPGGSMAALDGADGRPGFGGMGTVGVINGNGQSDSQGLGGWAVGATPRMLPDGIAARLPKGSDFLLQVHFHPSGKPETEKSLIGIYFSDRPPDKNLMSVEVPSLFGLGRRHRHPGRDEGLRDPRLVHAAGRRARVSDRRARALPRAADEGGRDAARRIDAFAAVDQGLGLQLAGQLHLQAAVHAAEGHADRRGHHLRQHGGESAQSDQPAAPGGVRRTVVRRNGRGQPATSKS